MIRGGIEEVQEGYDDGGDIDNLPTEPIGGKFPSESWHLWVEAELVGTFTRCA